jgi:3-oxoacyl-[acyl-carrier-protein] synthase-3
MSKLIATGSYLPEKVLTNADLEKMVDTNGDWIVERTGIKERRIAADNELTSDLATQACNNALNKAGISPSDIDLIIVATTTPDQTFPSTAVIVQEKLGIKQCAAFDVQAVCTGFIYALSVADSLLKSGNFKRALVVGAETITRIVDWSDRNTCVLFGDGAGAVILEASSDVNQGILAFSLHSDNATRKILMTDGGVSQNQKAGLLRMEGKEVFKHAVIKLAECTIESLKKANLQVNEVDFVIPHQANQRILEATITKLGVPVEKLISTVALHGNTSAASIPLALDNAFKENKFKTGDILAMQAIGGGLTWGSVILKL